MILNRHEPTWTAGFQPAAARMAAILPGEKHDPFQFEIEVSRDPPAALLDKSQPIAYTLEFPIDASIGLAGWVLVLGEEHRVVVSGRIGRVVRGVGFVVIAGFLLGPGAAAAAPDAKAARAATAQLEQTIQALSDTQKALAGRVEEVHGQLAELQRRLTEAREEQRQKQEALQGVVEQALTQVKEMREEVRGLYVESSGIKGDVAQAGKQVEALDQSLSSFRLSAGIIIALVVVLQLVLMGLTLRSRG